MVNNVEMGAVAKSIATTTQGASVLPIVQSRKGRAPLPIHIIKHPYAQQFPKCE